MSARDMAQAVLVRKAEGLGYRWTGSEFVHDGLRLRIAPVSKRGFVGGGAGIDRRATFAKLVARYNQAREQGQAA